MKQSKRILIIFLLLNILLLSGFMQKPVITDEKTVHLDLEVSFSKFTHFMNSLNQKSGLDGIYGLYVPDKLSFQIEQQPNGHPEYVSNHSENLTQFSLISAKNSYGLLAHNHLAGKFFSSIFIDDFLITIDKTGTHIYQVVGIENYQALSPNSPYSNFLALDGSNKQLTATQLFTKIYNQENHLILQTCLEKDGELSWGRTFIIAEEITDTALVDYFVYDKYRSYAKNN